MRLRPTKLFSNLGLGKPRFQPSLAKTLYKISIVPSMNRLSVHSLQPLSRKSISKIWILIRKTVLSVVTSRVYSSANPLATPARGFACAKHRCAFHKAQNLPQGRYLCLLWTLRESNSRLGNANAALYHLTKGPCVCNIASKQALAKTRARQTERPK